MSKPVELLVYEFLKASIEASVPGSVLYPLELHDTVYQTITKPFGIRVSDAVSDLMPDTGGGLKEFDADVHVVCFAKVEGVNQKQRAAAVQAVFDIQRAVIQLFVDTQDLGGRVCDVIWKKTPRSYDVFDGKPYAVALIPLVINPSGHH